MTNPSQPATLARPILRGALFRPMTAGCSQRSRRPAAWNRAWAHPALAAALPPPNDPGLQYQQRGEAEQIQYSEATPKPVGYPLSPGSNQKGEPILGCPPTSSLYLPRSQLSSRSAGAAKGACRLDKVTRLLGNRAYSTTSAGCFKFSGLAKGPS
jgi:hypothetical protein